MKNGDEIMRNLFANIKQYSKTEYTDVLHNYMINDCKKMIITANSEILIDALNDISISEILLDKNVDVIADGISLVKASKIYKSNIKERIPGIEIVEDIIFLADSLNKSMYLFGSTREVLKSLLEIIKKEYPNINIIGSSHGFVKNRDVIAKDIIYKRPDICLVALGVPDQEKFIHSILYKTTKGIFVGVGGSFDVLSGKKKRAPLILRKLNLEWLYRISCEPKRLKRFARSNITFMKIILKDKFKRQ